MGTGEVGSAVACGVREAGEVGCEPGRLLGQDGGPGGEWPVRGERPGRPEWSGPGRRGSSGTGQSRAGLPQLLHPPCGFAMNKT